MPDVLPPICADCDDHGDGSYTCDPDRPACRYRVRPHDDLTPAPSPAAARPSPDSEAGEMTEAGELRVRLQYVEHDLEHVAVERDRLRAAEPPHDLRDDMAAVLHRQGCREDSDGSGCGGACVEDTDALLAGPLAPLLARLTRAEAAHRHIAAIAAANPGSKGTHYADAARILTAALTPGADTAGATA